MQRIQIIEFANHFAADPQDIHSIELINKPNQTKGIQITFKNQRQLLITPNKTDTLQNLYNLILDKINHPHHYRPKPLKTNKPKPKTPTPTSPACLPLPTT